MLFFFHFSCVISEVREDWRNKGTFPWWCIDMMDWWIPGDWLGFLDGWVTQWLDEEMDGWMKDSGWLDE